MVNARLVYQLEKTRCIPTFQSGFRKGRSTLDNIINLETQIRNAFVRRNHLVSIFFDIEKAYDHTWRHGILRSLHDSEFQGNLSIFIQNFLSSRIFRVRLGNIFSQPFIQDEGVPQGSVLSVTLFSLHFSKILTILPLTISASLYVDDLQISCQGSDINLIERQLQNAVNKLLIWCNDNGHTLSLTKSSCVHFCRKRGMHPDPVIRIYDTVIPVVEKIPFLGIIFDRKLTFLPHVLQLRKRCEKLLNIIKVLSTTSWGADRTALLRIYHSVILSRIDYGCEVYGSACSSVLRRLDPIHHCVTDFLGSFPDNTGTQPVRNLSSDAVTPASKKVRLYAARTSNILPFCERMKRSLGDLDISTVQVYHIDFFSFPPWDVPQFSFLNPFSKFDKSTTNPVVFQQIFLSHRTQFCTYSPIFTDGSKTASRVGSGVVFDQNAFSRRLNASCSVLTAELMAIWLALEKVFTLLENTFCIYSDSLSALETLSHPQTSTHPIASKILCLLARLKARDCEILFCWIPSHVGIHGNELADTAAKSASIDLNHPLPYADIKKSLLIYVYSLWQESWDQQIRNKLHSIQPFYPLFGAAWPIWGPSAIKQ
ncbi:putative RNA-directed DNA polymerase from transposon BS [Araneus ventricosus]|uniref:Putative RNA-directed DNA polymerase from transposon BS n=1 Tax=Araneus ventricosus TaxID=182803 RepID=A0A4Y2SAU4_ARAVE|nr:putative RNA-directed DNA polymerase from transposon BS [Araneus ventricosus]